MIVAYAFPGDDPFLHLAREEWLLRFGAPDCIYVSFWSSRAAVAMGRFQSLWHEVNLDFLAQHRWPIIRRQTGGGSVVLGQGNLCWGVIRPGKELARAETMKAWCQWLGKQGLEVHSSDRTDIVTMINGAPKKISGSAFKQTKDRHWHHGTLLIDYDLSHLREALRAPKLPIKTKGLPSNPSSVVNLSDLIAESDLKKISTGFLSELEQILGVPAKWDLWDTDGDWILSKAKELSSVDWLVSSNPPIEFAISSGKNSETFKLKKGALISEQHPTKAMPLAKLINQQGPSREKVVAEFLQLKKLGHLR